MVENAEKETMNCHIKITKVKNFKKRKNLKMEIDELKGFCCVFQI